MAALTEEQSVRIQQAAQELQMALDVASRPGLELRVEHEFAQTRALQDQFQAQINHRIRVTAVESI